MDNTSGQAVDRKKEQPNDKLASESRSAPAADQSINQYWANLTHNLAIQGLIGKGVLPDTKLTSPTAPKAESPAQARQPETKPKVEQAPAPGAELKAGSTKPAGAPEKPAVKARPQELPKTVPAKEKPAEVPGSVPANVEGVKAKPSAQGRTDTVPPNPTEGGEQTPAKTRALYNLSHRTSDAKTPDAMVVIPPNFDKNKPVNLVIYNHGWYDTASSSLKHADLEQQMKNAPPNTVLIVPEWQTKPGSSGKGASNEGRFGNENFVSGMVQDVFNNTPELKGKTLADVNHVGIISHSAGYVPTESELYKNPELAGKVNSVTMLDSLYDGHGLDKWIHQNIAGLSDGTKHYSNIYNTSTARNSEIQSQFVANELKKYGGSKASEFVDHSGTMLTANQMRKHPINFKSTSMPHMEIPKNYVAVTEEAADRT